MAETAGRAGATGAARRTEPRGMLMAQAMNGLVDGVLQAFQERLAAVEMDFADLRGELVSIRRELDALRRR